MKQVRFFGIVVLSLLLSYGVAYACGPGGYRYGGRSPGYSYPYGTAGTHGSSGTSGTYGSSGGGYGLTPSGHPAYIGGQGKPSASGGAEPEGYRSVRSPACENFLNKTADRRKEFEVKRSDYWELKRNPKANPEDLAREQGEVQALWRKIQQENPDRCRWEN
jgi:hypothetical protein